MECLYTLILASLLILASVDMSKSSNSFSTNQNFNDVNKSGMKYFESSQGNALQRKYTIMVQQKTEDCYFVTELMPGRTFKVDFVVC